MGGKSAVYAKRQGDAPSPYYLAGLSDPNLHTCKTLWTGFSEDDSHPSDCQINEQCFSYHVLDGKLLVIFFGSQFPEIRWNSVRT